MGCGGNPGILEVSWPECLCILKIRVENLITSVIVLRAGPLGCNYAMMEELS